MIFIDSVYQKVLALANKEQRGYVTPLEFNLFANQAQIAIFEQYFYDLNQFKRQPTDTPSKSDIVEGIESKLAPFTTIVSLTGGTKFPSNYRTGKIFANPTGARILEPRLVSYNELQNLRSSKFHNDALTKDLVYVESSTSGDDVEVWNQLGKMVGNVTGEIISKPGKVEWGYDVIAGKALYNASRSTNFFLHASEEPELVIAILKLAGITLNKPGLVQAATQEEAQTIQQEKQ